MNELIDYFNENYTKKIEYILKDASPFIIKKTELEKILESEENMNGESYFYWKINDENIEGLEGIINVFNNDNSIKLFEKNITKINENGKEIYFIVDIPFIKIKDIFIMGISCEELEVEEGGGITIQLSILKNSISLPKLEYPKNKMDMYRAYNFIKTVNYTFEDDILENYLEELKLPFPKNIDEMDLYSEDSFHIVKDMEIKFTPKEFYYINQNKDNYYTVLDAIKKGKNIYMYDGGILPYWKINKEEKKIYLKSSWLGISAEVSEDDILIVDNLPR